MTEERAVARILLVDDHDLFRGGLKELINSQLEFEVVGEASDGLEAIKMARDLKPDLIIMDIQMPVSNGIEATQLICKQQPGTRIVMLTVREEDEYLFSAIKAGAVGYLLKNMDKANFFTGIRTVLAGEVYFPPAMATLMIEEFARLMNDLPHNVTEDEIVGLTPREYDVLEYVSAGATDKEIAALLSISVYTVKSHMRSILEKLHVSNRREAARLAKNQGLLK